MFGGLADRDLRQLELSVNSNKRLDLDEERESEKPILEEENKVLALSVNQYIR